MLLSQPIISLFRSPGTNKASRCTSARFCAERLSQTGDWEGGRNKKTKNEEESC